MKNLWITLLVSVSFCCSSFVFSGNGERTVSELKAFMEASNFEVEKRINSFDFGIKNDAFYHPSFSKYAEKWQNYRDTLLQELEIATIPKGEDEAKLFKTEWNNKHKTYIKNSVEDEYHIKEWFEYLPLYIGDKMYHPNENYNELLSETLKARVKSTLVNVGYYFMDNKGRCCFCFCFGKPAFPSNLKLQLGETSRIPMVFDVACPYDEDYRISELWINEQLVSQNPSFDFLENARFNLIYNGEDSQTVKINFKRFFNSVETEKQMFDFDIKECDK